MIRQPLPLDQPEASSEQYDEQATIANDMMTNFSAIPMFNDCTIDDLIMQPYHLATLTLPLASDVRFDVMPYTSSKEYVNWSLIAVNAFSYFDFDYALTFRAIKHERGRGRYRIFWLPGLSFSDSKEVPSDLTNKAQKFEWDLEQQSVYTITLKGMKQTSTRSSYLPHTTNTDGKPSTDSINTYSSFDRYPPSLFGSIMIHELYKYEASNVGPDNATVFIDLQFLKPQFGEYHSPLGSIDICSPLIKDFTT